MAKGKYGNKKSPKEARQYRSSLGTGYVGFSETYSDNTSLLTGSDKFSSDYGRKPYEQEEIARKSIKLTLKDFLKENWISIVVTCLAIPFFIWLASSVISLNKEQAVQQYRLERIEIDLDKISEEIPDKDSIRRELDSLKEDIDKIDDEFEDRLDKLEAKVYGN